MIYRKGWITQIIILFTVHCSLFTLIGCDAFIRKFTRKPKKENLPKEELLIAPEEYKAPLMSKEDLYRQYFLYWKSWQDELIDSLSANTNHKKRIACADEAMKNLLNLKMLLNEEKQKKIDIYIVQMAELKISIAKDVYCNITARYRIDAERIKRNILRDFTFNKISKDITS